MRASTVGADYGHRSQSVKKDGAHGVQTEANPRMEKAPEIDLVKRIGQDGAGRSMESVAEDLASMPISGRQSALRSLQKTKGNSFVQRLAIQLKTQVRPGEYMDDQESDPIPGQADSKLETGILQRQAEAKSNRTGMPDHLKAGIEALSGLDMSDIRVHTNSDKPSKLNALAFAQGNKIHLGPGQERYLPHEAWHVVQQKQGRVRPTIQMKGVEIDDDAELEDEANVMGARSAQLKSISKSSLTTFSQGIARIPKMIGSIPIESGKKS